MFKVFLILIRFFVPIIIQVNGNIGGTIEK